MLFRLFSSSFLLIIALLGVTPISVASPLAMVVNLDQRRNPNIGEHSLRVARIMQDQNTWLKRKQKKPASFLFALCIGTKNCYIYDSSLNTVTTVEAPKYTSPNKSIMFDKRSTTSLGSVQKTDLCTESKVIDILVKNVDIEDDIAWIEKSIIVMGRAGAFPDVNKVLQK
ncbi:hypothetical protein F5879DRAFT_977233 [Lentinula edodes]|nr:hypothetical protein F5879DRAFT_977233 [Lentinula edodes]